MEHCGQYTILGNIGEGAHGIVFKAKHIEVCFIVFILNLELHSVFYTSRPSFIGSIPPNRHISFHVHLQTSVNFISLLYPEARTSFWLSKGKYLFVMTLRECLQ